MRLNGNSLSSRERWSRWVRPAAAPLVLVVALTPACDSGGDDTCRSPRAVSPAFEGDTNADPDNQETWDKGVRIDTTIPSDVDGLVVGFRAPNQNDWDKDNDSDVMHPRQGSVGVRIGRGSVQFSVQLQAEEGSPTCDQPPDVTFTEQPTQEMIAEGIPEPTWS